MRAIGLLTLLAGLAAAPALGQDLAALAAPEPGAPVALVADSVQFDETTGVLRAEGDVEIYYGVRTLTAQSVSYDSRADRIFATGPITLRAERGVTLFADAAELDPQLRDGVIAGAKALIAQGGGQLAAVEARRLEGRYTAFAKGVYSSCTVCAGWETPLWRVRARRALHDAETRQLHFEDATVDVMGVPIAWLPYFRLPDPTVKRASGFLAPTFLHSSHYGYAAKIPYFHVIDASRDATTTLFATSDDGVIGEWQYRQSFDIGWLRLGGSLGWVGAAAKPGRAWRGHLTGAALFRLDALPGKAEAGFEVALASDDSYLRRFDYSDRDRLENEAFLRRYEGRDYDEAAIFYVQSLREGESDGEIAVALPEFESRRVWDAPMVGGALGLTFSGANLLREDGRDVGRLSIGLDWERQTVLPMGVALRGFAALRADAYVVNDDPAFEEGAHGRFAPWAGVEARWPLISDFGGASHVLEPIVQLVLAPVDLNPSGIPNEDSPTVEFDETNLFDVNRFSGFDRVESGSRVNLGARYALTLPSGAAFTAIGGRSLRLSNEGAFSKKSGLKERASDYVAAFSLALPNWLTLDHRLRLSDDFQVNRADLGARLALGRLRADLRYVFLESDATAGALRDRQEVAFKAEIDLDRNWTIGGAFRRNLETDRFVRTRGTLGYRDECAALEAFVERDFTDAPGDPASTTIGVSARIFGVADGGAARSALCGARYRIDG